MSGATPELALGTAQDSDDTEQYLTVNLAAALAILDALFNVTTGHDHSAAHKGAPIPAAGLAASSVTPSKLAIPWIAFTPTLSQNGALTLSAAAGYYLQIGKLVVATVDITINSSGTSGQAIVLGGLPVNVTTGQGGMAFGIYLRSGGPVYTLAGHDVSATTIDFYTGGVNTQMGITPAFAAAAGDVLRATIIYQGP